MTDHDHVRHARQVAGALHGLAAELAGPQLSEHDLDQMAAANAALAEALARDDRSAASAADETFHGVVLEASGNPVIAEVLAGLTAQVRADEHHRSDSVAQHNRIIEWFRQGDPAAAAAATRANWRHG